MGCPLEPSSGNLLSSRCISLVIYDQDGAVLRSILSCLGAQRIEILPSFNGELYQVYTDAKPFEALATSETESSCC